ncbi:PAS domain S-box protein [Thermodesulfobacteriota bacterium]
MTCKPAHEELEQKVGELEKEVSELKQRDEKLRENEWVLNQVQNIARIGSWYMDFQTGESGLSDELYKIYGVDSEFDCAAKNIIEKLIHPDDREKVQSAFEKAFSGTSQPALEWRIVRPDGMERIMYSRGAKVSLDKDNKPSKIIAPVQDITEFRQMERGLIRSEEKYRRLINNIAGVAYKGYKDWSVEFFDEKITSITGYELDEFNSRKVKWIDIIVKEDIETVKNIFIQALKTDRSYVREYRIKTKPGDVRWIQERGRIIFDQKGEIGYITGIFFDITDRKQAEEALREKEATIKSIFRAAPTGIGMVADRVIVQANERLCEIVGYSREALLGKSARMLYPTDQDFEYVGREKYAQIREHGTGTVETRFQRKDGQVIDVLLSSTPIDRNDFSIGVTFTVLDITHRKQAEEALRESIKTLAEIVEAIPSGLFIYRYEPQDRLILLAGNPAAERLTGINLGESLGKEFNKIWPKALEMGITDSFLNVVKTGKIYEVEDLQYKDKRIEGAFKTTVFPIPGQLLGVTFENISERKKTENALQRSEKRFRKLFEESNDAIFIHDLEGKIYDLNHAALNMTGYAKASLLERVVSDLHPEADQPGAYQALEETRQNGHARFQSRFMRADQSIITVDISSSVIDEDEGLVQELVRDITKQRQMEDQLRQTQRIESIGTLAGGIAHDFNNILSPIILHTEMMLEDTPEESPLCFNLEEVHSASIRARDLTNQILTFSRQTEQERIPLIISPIIKETLKLLRFSFPSTIEIRQTVETAGGSVLADQTQIQQILMNLCTNAAYAMREEGGVLEVGLADIHLTSADIVQNSNLAPGHYINLTVRDTGPGMESSVKDRIFDPYFTTKDKGEGAGLGLAVVHGIVKSYDGAITVDSEPGKGTAFQVFLPKIEGHISSKPADAVQLPVGTESILLIDDEQSMLKAMQQMLERLGYTVDARWSSIEALEAFRDDSDGFDLVITDYTMPEMTGENLAKAMMGIRPDVPVILCTGFSEQIDEEKSKAIGIRAFVMKPIIMREMAKTIRQVLDNDK